jgi:hypothetical protein
MFDEGSALSQAPSSFIKLTNAADSAVEISPKRVKELLRRFHCFPLDNRKQLWSYILQLPNNTSSFNTFMSKAQLPQARRLCSAKGCGRKTLAIVNALIHWHAPLINCDWLPPLVQKLVHGFRDDTTFCFEVSVTFLTNFFVEWISDFPGPPPEVLSRIDAIFSNHDPDLRDALGTAIVTWPVYRSIFAELLYDRNWLDLMDIVVSSSPQFLEFAVVAWMAVNGPQLRIDHATFHSTRRAVNIDRLVKAAKAIGRSCSPTLLSRQRFRALPADAYPIIEASREAVVLRTLQSDHGRLALLQQQLQEERRQADEAEKIKERRKQTFESIQQLHRAEEDEERIETAKAASALDQQMKRLKLEGKLLRQADERQFLEAWESDWEAGIDVNSARGVIAGLGIGGGDETIDGDGVRFLAMTSMRQADAMNRDARRNSMVRANHARSELDSQLHQRAMHGEVMRLANNPVLLTKASAIRPTARPKLEED